MSVSRVPVPVPAAVPVPPTLPEHSRSPQAAGAGPQQLPGAERGAGGAGAALWLPDRPGLRGHVLGGPRAARARDQ